MGEHRRKADGRRVFSTEFKRTTVQRVLTGEKTVAELSHELDIAPSVIRNWKRFAEGGATTVEANEDVVPASHLREAYARIRDLERALGRKTMEVEILRAAQEAVKKTPFLRRASGRSPGGRWQRSARSWEVPGAPPTTYRGSAPMAGIAGPRTPPSSSRFAPSGTAAPRMATGACGRW
jgi:transposase